MFSLCTASVLLCPDCPGFDFSSTTHKTQKFIPLAGFEPATPASDRTQALVVYSPATEIGPKKLQKEDTKCPNIMHIRGQVNMTCTVLLRCTLRANENDTYFPSTVRNRSYLNMARTFLKLCVLESAKTESHSLNILPTKGQKVWRINIRVQER